ELVAGGGHAALFARADHAAADGVHLAAAAVPQVGVNAGQAVGGVVAHRFDLGHLLVIVKFHAQAGGGVHGLPDQGAAQLPGVLVGRNVAQGHLQGAGQRAGGNVGEQLVPDHLLHAVGNVGLQAAGGEGVGKLLQPAGAARHAAHVGHAAAAVPGHTQARHAGVVLGGADDDVVLRDEFAPHVLMAAAVLQRHQVGVGSDDALVGAQAVLP